VHGKTGINEKDVDLENFDSLKHDKDETLLLEVGNEFSNHKVCINEVEEGELILHDSNPSDSEKFKDLEQIKKSIKFTTSIPLSNSDQVSAPVHDTVLIQSTNAPSQCKVSVSLKSPNDPASSDVVTDPIIPSTTPVKSKKALLNKRCTRSSSKD